MQIAEGRRLRRSDFPTYTCILVLELLR